MAQVDSQNNPNDPTNPNNPATQPNQVQQQGTNQPATSGGSGAVTSTGAGNVTGQVTGTNNPAQPFQNISSYLAANAPQSAQLAGQVASTVSQPIAKAGTDITSAADTFNQSVNAGYTPENNDLITAVSNNPAYVVAENPDNVTNFTGQLNDKYTGPTDFTQASGYNDLQTEIAAAQAAAANTQTPTGVQTLLQGVEGPTTAGINKLDSLLLNQNPENLATIQAAGAPAADLAPALSTATTTANTAAAQGSTNAAKAAADAAAALQTAQGSESKNLSSEQQTIQDLVNQYNQSIGVINPVVSDISSAISNFLAANPNVKLSNTNDPLAALENLASIVMPSEASYASPEDYAQIAALMQLGDTTVGNLPISSATASQANTFNLPTQLQDAVGQSPAVEQALTDELGGFQGQINTAVAPFEAAQQQADQGRGDYAAIVGNTNIYSASLPDVLTDPTTGAQVPMNITTTTQGPRGPVTTSSHNPAYDALAKKAYAARDMANAGDKAIGDLAPGLQWVNSASTDYNSLISEINAELQKLGSVGVPSLNYAVKGATPSVAGAPIGISTNNAAKLGATATQVGTPIAAGAGAGTAAAASEAASEAALGNLGEGLATSGAEGAEQAAENAVALQTGLSAIPPAALAAYGTSNIIKNASNHPLESGLSTLANTGLSLATLSLPPQIFNSIGKAIKSVIDDIGNFFGGLF